MADEVTFRCKRTVVSTREVQSGKFYDLSVLDRMAERDVLRIVYYYRFPPETVTADGAATAELRESLAEVLSSYPVMTGRLQRTSEGMWVIKCNDAGVRMIEARARGSVEEWLQTADREQELKLTHWEDMYDKQYFWSTFYVKITEFERGGVAIGLSCTHLLADAASATGVIRAWADVHLTGKMLSPPYFHPLPPRRKFHNRLADHRREPCVDLINHYVSAMECNRTVSSSNHESYSTVAFGFRDEMVKRCVAEAAGSRGMNPTPFEALAALFWVSISSVKGRKEGLLDMSVCLDMRKALGLSREFFGNAMIFGDVDGEGIEGGSVDQAAKAVGDAVRGMEYEGVMDLIQWLEKGDGGARPPSLYGPRLVFANWEGLGSYEAVFVGGVEPIRVSYYLDRVIGEGQVLILASPKGQGCSLSRVVMVTLPKDQMMELCEEVNIIRFSPTILMKA